MSKNSLQLSSTNALPATRMKPLGALLFPLLLVEVGAGAGASNEEAVIEGRGLTACCSAAQMKQGAGVQPDFQADGAWLCKVGLFSSKGPQAFCCPIEFCKHMLGFWQGLD